MKKLALFAVITAAGAIAQAAAEKVMTGSSGHKRVPVEFYEDLDVPNISLAEQEKIVAKIRADEEKISLLRKMIADCRAEKARIVEAFLK